MKIPKNILLITFYWPPAGGAGVYRWLRFSKYFKKNGCNLTVYCPENANWPIIDNELTEQIPKEIKVIRRKIFEPHKYLNKKNSKGIGFSQSKKAGVIQTLIIWIRGNLFIPDARMFWIKPSTKFLSKYLKNHPEINTIISTGPPHSTHLIARNLKRKFGLKWLADFRDPWTQIDFYEDLLPSKYANTKQKKLEKMCLIEADEVITVSESCGVGLEKISSRKIHIITNGYDFPTFDSSEIKLDKDFTIVHFGSMPFARNPKVLWDALSELIEEEDKFASKLKINLIGTTDYQVIDSIKKAGLKPYLSLISTIKHSESLKMQRKSQLLLLSVNNTGNIKGIITGKFFEYLGAKRPIIVIGKEGSDLEKIFKTTQAGHFSDFQDKESTKKYILNSFHLYQQNKLFNTAINIEKFHSESLAKNFIKLI